MKNYRPVIIMAPGILAGAEKVVLSGLNALDKAGATPHIIIIKETRVPHFAENFRKLIPPNIKVMEVLSKRALDISLPAQIKKILKSEVQLKDDMIVFHTHGFKALIACSLMRGDIKHIHTHHGNTSHTLKVKIYEKIAMLIMKRCHHIIAVSEKMKNDLLVELSPFKKISVVSNMLSFNKNENIPKRRSQSQAHTNELIHLLYAGRLSPEKGILNFLKFFNNMNIRYYFKLTIIGDGFQRAEIEQFIHTHNLSSQVELKGMLPDPQESFLNADLLIMPSLREGLPMTLIEALASGLPVIANNVGAISTLIKPGLNGYLCETTQLSWSKGLSLALSDLHEWKKYTLSEAQNITERFSQSKWALETKLIYNSVL